MTLKDDLNELSSIVKEYESAGSGQTLADKILGTERETLAALQEKRKRLGQLQSDLEVLLTEVVGLRQDQESLLETAAKAEEEMGKLQKLTDSVKVVKKDEDLPLNVQ